MDVGTEKLCGFCNCSAKSVDRQVGEPLRMELFHGQAMGEHVDHVANADPRAFYRELSAGPVRTGLKIFVLHSMSIVARRLAKVNSGYRTVGFTAVAAFERAFRPRLSTA